MKNAQKMLSTVLAAITLASTLSLSPPASAWDRYGGRGGWGPHFSDGRGWGWRHRWGYGGWRSGAGLAASLALADSNPYGYWGSGYGPGYWPLGGCGYYGVSDPCSCGW